MLSLHLLSQSCSYLASSFAQLRSSQTHSGTTATRTDVNLTSFLVVFVPLIYILKQTNPCQPSHQSFYLHERMTFCGFCHYKPRLSSPWSPIWVATWISPIAIFLAQINAFCSSLQPEPPFWLAWSSLLIIDSHHFLSDLFKTLPLFQFHLKNFYPSRSWLCFLQFLFISVLSFMFTFVL